MDYTAPGPGLWAHSSVILWGWGEAEYYETSPSCGCLKISMCPFPHLAQVTCQGAQEYSPLSAAWISQTWVACQPRR